MKTFKANFLVPTKDLKNSENIQLPVTTNISDNMEINTEVEFSVVLPDFMFNEVANTEEQFKTEHDPNIHKYSGCFSNKTITRKFKKTQTATLISTLQNYFYELTTFINDKYSIETSTMKKKIFISFNHKLNHTKNDLNAAYTGEKVVQSFQYFTGYEVMTDKFSGINKKITKRYVGKILYYIKGASLYKMDTNFKEKDDLFLPLTNYNESVEDFEKRFSIIDWTEEREQFCEKLKQKFVDVNLQLDIFLKNIDDNKINNLLSNFEEIKSLNS